MNVSIILTIFLTFLTLECVTAQLISELECKKISSLNTDPKSLNPHLMEFVYVYITGSGLGITPMCTGTLISENFVLTVYAVHMVASANFNGDREIQIKVRKFKVAEEDISIRELFNIKRVIKSQDMLNNIGLVELVETVPYQDISSIYRPACLWTGNNRLTSKLSYAIYKDTSIDKINVDCSEIQSKWARDISFNYRISFRCTLPTNIPDIKKMFYHATVETQHRNQIYIVGFLDYAGVNSIGYDGIKFADYLWKIESIVWPNYEFGCGKRILAHTPLIALGRSTQPGEYPWHVALYRLDNNHYKYICGGSIISDRAVLTAAHCVSNELGFYAASRFKILAGVYNLSETTLETKTYFVDRVMVHEYFQRRFFQYDIALLKLNTSILFSYNILPICFGNKSDFGIVVGTVVGWGRDENQQGSDVLLQATAPIHTDRECRLSNIHFMAYYLNDDYNYCAGYRNGTSVCIGDSGGGMIFEYESRFYIRGIVSSAPALLGGCDITKHAIFTDVSKFYDWILDILNS